MSANAVNWKIIADRIAQRKCTPVIGNHLIGQVVFGDINVSATWAEHEKYPLVSWRNLTRVAQYLSFTRGAALDAKLSYLSFLKDQLLIQASNSAGDNQEYLKYLGQVKTQVDHLTFSQLACDRLHRPNFKKNAENPLSILATLDIPVYLTTRPHRVIEAALSDWDKTPRTEVYAWRQDLEEVLPAEILPDPSFTPTVQTPLVFHLHGIDDEPLSLVLTEDDHLEFLVNITQDLREAAGIRKEVRNAISTSLLLLLGYRMHAWDLRVLLQGIIRKKQMTGRMRSFVAQLEPQKKDGVLEPDLYPRYLTSYFGRMEFDIYWGTPHQFLQTLWQTMEER